MTYILCPYCNVGHVKFPSDYNKMINKTYKCPRVKDCGKETPKEIIFLAWKNKIANKI